MTTLKRLLFFMVIALQTGCSNPKVPESQELNASIEKQVESMSIGQEKQINISVPHSSIVVAPPYSVKSTFDGIGLSDKLSKKLTSLMTNQENIDVFVIEKEEIKVYSVLNSNFSLKDGKAIKVESPKKITVKRES